MIINSQPTIDVKSGALMHTKPFPPQLRGKNTRVQTSVLAGDVFDAKTKHPAYCEASDVGAVAVEGVEGVLLVIAVPSDRLASEVPNNVALRVVDVRHTLEHRCGVVHVCDHFDA